MTGFDDSCVTYYIRTVFVLRSRLHQANIETSATITITTYVDKGKTH